MSIHSKYKTKMPFVKRELMKIYSIIKYIVERIFKNCFFLWSNENCNLSFCDKRHYLYAFYTRRAYERFAQSWVEQCNLKILIGYGQENIDNFNLLLCILR